MHTKRRQQSKRKQREPYAALIKAYERNALEYGRLPDSEGDSEVESEHEGESERGVESETTRRARDEGDEHPRRAGKTGPRRKN